MNNFVAPPMSGENVPFKEMEEEHPPAPPAESEGLEKTPKPVDRKKIKRLKMMMVVSIVFFAIIIILLVAFLLKPKPEPAPLPSPSPSPSPIVTATPSAVGKNVVERIEALEKQVDALDLSETDLAFPILDFEINFDKDR